jgi:hypothetical protein
MIIYVFKKPAIFTKPWKFFLNTVFMGEMIEAGARAGAAAKILNNLEPEPHENRPPPQHWWNTV